jgi:hypothetical protein
VDSIYGRVTRTMQAALDRLAEERRSVARR